MRTFTQKWAFLLVALLCCVGLPMQADDLTVNDGTTTNEYVPIYGYYGDTSGKSQFVVPSADLSDIAGGSISGLSFYANADFTFTGTWEIRLMETTEASVSSDFLDVTQATLVYSGPIEIAGGVASVEFEDAFSYVGGNLLVEVYLATTGSYSGSGLILWYGVATGTSRGGSGSYPYSRSFLPKVTFEYEPAGGVSCSKPSTLQVSDITTDAATLAWADGSGVYNVEYKVDTVTEWTSLLANSNAVSASLSGLNANTTYNVRVQSVCSVLDTVSSWRSTSFKTACGMITSFPYLMDFEDLQEQTFPACWDNSGSTSSSATSSYSSYYVWGVYANDGNKMMRMYNAYTSNGTALINTPSIVLPDGQEFELTFDYSHRASCGDFTVKVSEDGGATWIDLQSFAKPDDVTASSSDPSNFTEAVISLADYAGKTIMLQFYSLANYGSGAIFVDNIAIGKHTDCAVPVDLAASEITKSSASIGWTAGGAETAWVMQYKKAADADWQSINVSENPYSLEELDAYTEYNVRIAASCAEDEQSKYSKSISFKTAAGIPFTENFNASSIPSDWKRYAVILDTLLNGDTALVSPITYGWTAGSSNGVFPGQNYHLQMEVYGTSRNHWIVSPAVELEENVQLTFDLALTKYSGTLSPVTPGEQEDDKFYVLYSLDNGETWDILKYWDNSSSDEQYDLINCSADGRAVKIDLSDYAGQSLAFAFYGESSVAGGDNNIHISNVRVDYIPACEKPVGLAVAAVTDHAVTFEWEEAEDGAANWQYALIENPAADTVPADEAFIGATSELTVTIENLNENTPYAFFLRRDCDGEHSEYLARSFRTIMTPAAIPFAEDFESETNWILENGTQTNAWMIGEGANNGGTHALYISKDGAQNSYNVSSATTVFAIKSFYFNEAATYTFRYDWKANGESTWDYLRVVLVPTSFTFEAGVLPAGLSATALPNGWIALDGGSNLSGSTTWATVAQDIDVEEGMYNLVLVWKNDGSGGSDAPAAVDNLSISKLLCARPINLALGEDGVSTTSAQLTWEAQGSESNWLLRYKKQADTEWTLLEEPVTANPFLLEGLDPATTYDAQVAAWCDPSKEEMVSEYSDIFSFATACEIISTFPYSENFDGLTASSYDHVMPLCWSHINTCAYQGYTDYSIYPTAYAGASYAHSGTNSLRFYSFYDSYTDYDPQDQYAVLPQMANVSGLRMKLQARAYSTSSSYATYDATFTVGVMTDPSDVTTFVPVATFTPISTSYSEYTVLFNTYAGAGEYIAIKAEAANANVDYRALLIDDIYIDEIPDCMEPEGTIAVSAVTAAGASFSWNNEEGAAWKYAYAPAAEAEPADEVFNAIDTNAVSISGLSANTAYTFYLRRNCGTSVSKSISVSFNTKQLPVALPYATDFEDGHDWMFINGNMVNAWAYGTDANNTEGGSHAIYVSNNGGVSNAYTNNSMTMVYATKAFTFTEGSYVFRYDWKANGEGAYDYLRVALVPASVELTAGTSAPSGLGTSALPTGWIALDGGSKLNGSTTWATFTTDETPVAAGEYNVVFAWKNDGSGGSDAPAAVDNISITKVACSKPTGLKASDLTASSASLSWAADEDQNAWQIVLTLEADLNLAEATPIDVASNLYAAAELESDTTYYFYVRAVCGEDQFSDWSNRASFKTAKDCQMPDDLALEALTTTTATISWNTYGQTSFDFRYGLNGVNWTEVEDVTSPYTIEGLEPGTTYQVQVKAGCSMDEWTDAQSFTTVFGVPFEEKFEATSVPNGWLRASGLLDNVIAGTANLTSSSSWSFGSSNSVFDSHAYLNVYGSSTRYWLITPQILTVGNMQLSFDLALTKYSGAQTAVEAGKQADDKFAVVISTDGGETWTKLRQWDNQGSAYVYDQISVSGDYVTIDLSAYSGQQIYLAFYAESTISGGDNNIHIDNVLIDAIPSCPKTTGLNLVSVSATEASFAWDAEADVTWEYGIVPDTVADFVPADADFTATASVNTVSIDTLSAQTNYLFFLRKVCGEDKSEIVYLAFKTTAVPASLPYDDGFEAGNNWELINGTMANAWVVGAAENNGGANALYISNDGGATNAYTNSAATVYAAKLFDFNESGSYTVSYDWKANGESTYDYLRVVLVPGTVELAASTSLPSGLTASAVPANWIALDGGTKLNLSTEWANKSVEVEVEPGLYYVVFVWRNDGSGGDQAPAAIDNIHIQHLAYPTGIESGAGIENQAVKFIHNDHVYILLNGNVYTVTGQKVELK